MLWEFCNLSLKRKYLPVNQMTGKNTAYTQSTTYLLLILASQRSKTKSILLNNKHKFIYAISLFRFEFVIVLCTNCEWVLWPPGYPRWKSFREIPLSNAFHPLQTFQLGSCTKSVQINFIHHQCVQLPTKGRKVKMQVFPSNCPGGQFILTFLSEVAAFEWLVTKVANGCTKVLAEHFHIIIANKFQAH